ncbi:MAG: (Fe-S)-binding protein [Desulfobacteraceae bacterium]|nr:(Fe-S)-binding protein [Desulfobacteraceae bacterium]MBC2756076.1 (Fe-S)-binding protein [Desulfobacteraceae bacterium]
MARLDQNSETMARPKSYIDAYDFDQCTECGECLYECIYKDLTKDQAIENISKMRQGDVAVCEAMLDQCVFCYNCSYSCPVNANPAALMFERLHERRNRERGVPASLQYIINGMESQGWTHNLFQDLYTDHNKDEKEIIAKWSEPKDCNDGDLLWCSCASRVFPYDIEQSHVLSGLQKFGGKSDCCGLPAFRSGLFDVGRFLANNLIDRFSQCRFKRLVVMCGSCQDMFQLALPEYFGQEFPFEMISVYQYLDEQIQNGNFQIKRQVTVDEKENTCIFHSCFGYKFGKDYLSCIKRLYQAVGFDCMELVHNGENNACCGMGGVYRQGNLWDIMNVKGVKKKDLKKSNKENILAYCYGCYFTSHLSQGGTTHFLLEKVLWALGDEIKYPISGILGRSFNFSSFIHMIGIIPSALF